MAKISMNPQRFTESLRRLGIGIYGFELRLMMEYGEYKMSGRCYPNKCYPIFIIYEISSELEAADDNGQS